MRIVLALGLLLMSVALGCGATEDPDAEPPRLAVAYVDEAGDVVIRGEPDNRSWRVSTDGTVFGMSWSPGADRLLITERLGDEWQLRLVETDRFTEVARVRLPERPGGAVTWRRDGAAFVLSGVDSATAYSRTGRTLWSLARGGTPLGWSPDGRWFAFDGADLNSADRMIVTDGSITHEVDRNALGLEDGLASLVGSWLIDGTISFRVSVRDGDTIEEELQAWQVLVSDDGLEFARPADPLLAMEYRLASEARDADGEAARAALVETLGGDEVAHGGGGGLRWVSARYDDADGHHRVFAVRDGATLSDLRITIGFGAVRFPQVVAAARAEDDR